MAERITGHSEKEPENDMARVQDKALEVIKSGIELLGFDPDEFIVVITIQDTIEGRTHEPGGSDGFIATNCGNQPELILTSLLRSAEVAANHTGKELAVIPVGDPRNQ